MPNATWHGDLRPATMTVMHIALSTDTPSPMRRSRLLVILSWASWFGQGVIHGSSWRTDSTREARKGETGVKICRAYTYSESWGGVDVGQMPSWSSDQMWSRQECNWPAVSAWAGSSWIFTIPIKYPFVDSKEKLSEFSKLIQRKIKSERKDLQRIFSRESYLLSGTNGLIYS